jgi:hypothetical protein
MALRWTATMAVLAHIVSLIKICYGTEVNSNYGCAGTHCLSHKDMLWHWGAQQLWLCAGTYCLSHKNMLRHWGAQQLRLCAGTYYLSLIKICYGTEVNSNYGCAGTYCFSHKDMLWHWGAQQLWLCWHIKICYGTEVARTVMLIKTHSNDT